MTINPRPFVAWSSSRRRSALSWRRSLILAMVLALHLGLWLALLQPAEPWVWPPIDDTQRDALQVRLTHLATGHSTPVTGHPDVQPAHHTRPHLPATPLAPSSPPAATARQRPPHADAPAAEPAASTTPLRLGLPEAATLTDRAAGYIPGGGQLSPPDVASGSAIDRHLPGRDGGVPGVVMADPRMQGAAGAVRVVRGLLGLRDKQCADVAVWRGMSTPELLAHHLDEKTVEAVAASHHCGLKPEVPFHNWRDFGDPVH